MMGSYIGKDWEKWIYTEKRQIQLKVSKLNLKKKAWG